MDSYTDTLGIRIMNRRKELSLSQGDLATMVGLSIPSISKIENDRTIPRTKSLEKIADALNVSVDSLKEPSPLRSDSDIAPYISEATERGGEDAAKHVQELLSQNIAMLAGGQLSQRAKDSFYRAITDAYFDCKDESERRKSNK